jgi:hypothetical protein
MLTHAAKGQRAIVEPDAMAEPRATAVERNCRNEDGVEKAGIHEVHSVRFMHSKRMAAAGFTESHEAHGARAQRSDARHVNLATARDRERDERRGAELLRHGGVDADALAARQPMRLRNEARNSPRGTHASGSRHGAACGEELNAEGGLRLHEKKRKALPDSAGASHCSRTRATRWDRP